MTYTLTQKEFVTLKGRLTAAKNKAKKTGDPQVIIDECNRAFAIFEAKGFPDDWHRWNIAKQDAELALKYKKAGLDYFIEGQRFERTFTVSAAEQIHRTGGRQS